MRQVLPAVSAHQTAEVQAIAEKAAVQGEEERAKAKAIALVHVVVSFRDELAQQKAEYQATVVANGKTD